MQGGDTKFCSYLSFGLENKNSKDDITQPNTSNNQDIEVQRQISKKKQVTIRLTTRHQLQRQPWPEQRSETEMWLQSRGQGQYQTALRDDNEEQYGSGGNLTYLSPSKSTQLWAESLEVTKLKLSTCRGLHLKAVACEYREIHGHDP